MTESNGDNPTAATATATKKPDWRESRTKRVKVWLLSTAAVLVMHLLMALIRLRPQPLESIVRHRHDGGGLIFAIFHGSHFPTLRMFRKRRMKVITSKSADGEILARIFHSFQIGTVRGSSSRGGIRALVDMARHNKAGGDSAIAVDGPRGPRHEVKPGIILLAKLTGCSIIPSAASLSRYWQINSWDRYRIPKPWSRALVVFGDPMAVPPDADDELIEAKRVELQDQLMTLQEQADEAVMTESTTQQMLAERAG